MSGLKWWFGLTQPENQQAKAKRTEALLALSDAQSRRDTRDQHSRYREAVSATCEALRHGA
jgi:hypothetical protein